MRCIAFTYGLRRGTSTIVRALALSVALGWIPARAQLTESYRIQPTDSLIVEVVNEPKLAAREFRVSSNGEISYPFIGSVRAAGRTTVEVQEEIKRLLETDYLVNAQVIVHVREYRKQQVAVFGQVQRPQLVDIPPERRMTVVEAIAAAGGLTRLARPSHIELTRQGSTERIRLRLEDLSNPEKPQVYVEPGDMVFVPESRI
jgi:polysaccharide export outer membrane protein